MCKSAITVFEAEEKGKETKSAFHKDENEENKSGRGKKDSFK